MLRGFATINYWTDDMEAARRWYAAFRSDAVTAANRAASAGAGGDPVRAMRW